MNNICIIDDDPITVFGIRKMLGLISDGNEVRSYANGKLALDGIKDIYQQTKKMPDVIFLDINMPIMDGWQFLKEFIALPLDKRVRINIVTSSIDPFDRQNFERYKKETEHILTYNNKPILKSQIEAITKKA